MAHLICNTNLTYTEALDLTLGQIAFLYKAAVAADCRKRLDYLVDTRLALASVWAGGNECLDALKQHTKALGRLADGK